MQVTVHALDALGSPVRRQILKKLKRAPLSVGDLADRFPVSRPAISRHLRVLQDAGLVESRGEGTRSLYTVRMAGFAPVREFIDEFWDEALSRLEAFSVEKAKK
jgi:DNA-binding transcriptional ArsR family regulator